MNRFNFERIAQTEAIKMLLTKDYQESFCEWGDYILLTVMHAKGFLVIPKQNFLLDLNRFKESRMLESIIKADYICPMDQQDEMTILSSTSQATAFIAHGSDDKYYIENKFLGYFKSIKGARYHLVDAHNGKLAIVTTEAGTRLGGTVLIKKKV